MADIVIRITAVDSASGVLIKIGDSAEKAAADLKKAGADGKKAMADIESGAKKTDKEMRTFERTSLAVGATLGALALGLIRVSDAYLQQERQIAAVTRLYGDASEGLLDYAETIQMTTRFSNDAARESAILLNTLTQNYGLSTDQIETLISRSADLAQLHGRTLTEVTQMVSNALRGEGEYIEQIGVSMNQTFVAAEAAARGLGNFISEMSQAEQAAFRYTLLLEQTAAAQGYAAEVAEGSRGAIALLKNEFGDLTQAVGGALGPISDVAAEFSAYALWMPLIFSQTARVSAIMVNAARSGELLARTMGILNAVTSPWGLAITGLITVGTLLGAKWLDNKQDAEQLAEAMKEVERTAGDLRTAIGELARTDLFGGRWAQDASIRVSNLIKDFAEVAEDEIAGLVSGESPLTGAFNKWLEDAGYELENLTNLRRGQLGEQFLATLMPTPEQQSAFNTAFAGFLDLEGVVGDITFDALTGQFDRMLGMVAAGTMTWDQFTATLEYMTEANAAAARSLEDVNVAQQALNASQAQALTLGDSIMASEAYDQYAQSVQDAAEAMDGLTAAEKEHADIFRAMWEGTPIPQEFTDWLKDQNDQIQERKESVKDAMQADRAWREELEQLGRAGDAGMEATIDHMRELAEEAQQVREDIINAYLAAFEADDPLSRLNLSSLRNEYTALAESIGNTGSQLETVFRVIVGNTDAIKSQAQGIRDWIDGLTMVEEGVSRIGTLMSEGYINQAQFDAAIQAHEDISAAQIEIANNIDTIQTMQAPFIAGFVQQQAQVLESLRGQSAEQQRITLGWMDTNTAAQAYTLITQAAAVANGDLGASGREAFHEMIEGAVAVNPFLFDMLETIGLISGTPLDFEVNFDGVSEGISEIERLTIRIEDLIRALGGDLTDIPIDVSVTGIDEIEEASTAADALLAAKGSVIGMSLEVTDNLSTGVGGIGAGLGKLLAGGSIDPVVIPATLQWGDGTGGATADNSFAGAIPDEPLQIPAEIDIQADRIDEYLSQQERTIEVQIETDAGQVEQALGALGQDQIAGPTFQFQPDNAEVISMIEVLSSGDVTGPTFLFQPDNAAVRSAAGTESAMDWWGPTFLFQADNSEVRSVAASTAGASYDGPTFRFQADTSAVASAIGAYAGRTVGTAYINVEARVTGSGAGFLRHGGIAGFAGGGIPAVLAENNRPEVLHFASGGSTTVQREGMYIVPPHTLVSPSNNDRSTGGGVTYVFNTHIGGSVVGEAELLGKFARQIVDDVERHRASVGLAS